MQNVKNGWKILFEKNNISEGINKTLLKIKNLNNVYPTYEEIFRVFELVDVPEVQVVILGQDPYHKPGVANGIAFSCANNINAPPSLKNIFKELKNDLDIDHTLNNDLSSWVKQGVLLLNTCLTVEKGKPGSHKNLGWEELIIKILNQLNKQNKNIIYCLWGNHAKNLYNNLEYLNELVIFSAHPSPFSYKKGFEGSKPFSKINNILSCLGKNPINWEK